MKFGFFYLPYLIPYILSLFYVVSITDKKINLLILLIALLYVFIFVGFRYEISNDYNAYIDIYQRTIQNKAFGIEIGYTQFLLMSQYLGGKYAQFVISTFLYVITICYLPLTIRQKCMFALLISSTYVWGDLGTIRQTISVLSLYLAFICRNRLAKLYWLASCLTMHNSGIVLLLFYYIYSRANRQISFFRILLEAVAIAVVSFFTYLFILPDDIIASLLYRFTAESLSNYSGDIKLGYQGVVRLLLVMAFGLFFCSHRDTFFNFNFYLIIFLIFVFFISTFLIDSLAIRFLSLSRFAEIYMSVQLVSGRLSSFKFMLLPILFTLFYLKGLHGFTYEYDLFYPYKSLLFE